MVVTLFCQVNICWCIGGLLFLGVQQSKKWDAKPWRRRHYDCPVCGMTTKWHNYPEDFSLQGVRISDLSINQQASMNSVSQISYILSPVGAPRLGISLLHITSCYCILSVGL